MCPANYIFVDSGEDENAGAGTCNCRSRGGAQTKVCDGKLLVEGESSPEHRRRFCERYEHIKPLVDGYFGGSNRVLSWGTQEVTFLRKFVVN